MVSFNFLSHSKYYLPNLAKMLTLDLGPLYKIRGTLQNHVRWYVLTSKKLVYYTENGGDLISGIEVAEFDTVAEMDAKRFLIKTRVPFGESDACCFS